MIVLTLARKPCSEGPVAVNVLKHGTGGINVDGCRVGVAASKFPSGMDRYNVRLAVLGYRPAPYSKGTPPVPSGTGRWPANLILGHLPDCSKTETKGKQPPSVRGKHKPAYRKNVSSWRFQNHNVNLPAEVAETWICKPACPVAALDNQSGIRPTGAWCRQTDTSHPFGGAAGVEYSRWKTVEEPAGGASRFFKQVQ